MFNELRHSSDSCKLDDFLQTVRGSSFSHKQERFSRAVRRFGRRRTFSPVERRKPLPVIVSKAPPSLVPEFGDTDLSVGAAVVASRRKDENWWCCL